MPGYVGYISDGGFHFLFDAGTELGSEEHNADLPTNFERLEVGPIKRRTRLPGCLHTATIRRIGTGGGDPPSILGCVCTSPGLVCGSSIDLPPQTHGTRRKYVL